MDGTLLGNATFFAYGLAFFSFGGVFAGRAAGYRSSAIRQRMFGLAAFGLIHGIFEWLSLVARSTPEPVDFRLLLAVAAASFLGLCLFALGGLGLSRRMAWRVVPALGAAWCAMAVTVSDPVVVEVVTRLALGSSASVAAAVALLRDRAIRGDAHAIGGSAVAAALCFVVYGLTQAVSTPAQFFPASVFNTSTFEAFFGVSCYLVRTGVAVAMMAAMLALFGRFDTALRDSIDTKAEELYQALSANEASLAKAQQIGNMGSWEWNIVTGDLAWSDQIYRIFGLEPQEFGASYAAFLERVHPDDRAHVEESVRRAVEERERYDISHRIVLPAGEVRQVHEQGAVDYSPAGKPLRMIGTVQDITERKTAEDALRDSRAMLFGILTIANEAIILADSDLKITLFSHGAQRVFGYAEDEAIGLPLNRLLPEGFLLRHKGRPERLAVGLKPCVVSGVRQEVQAARKNGEAFPAAVSLSTLPAGDRRLYLVILRDVGIEKAAHAELTAAKVAAEAANTAKSRFLANMSHELRTPLSAIIGFSKAIAAQAFGPAGSGKYVDYAGEIGEAGNHLLVIINDILDYSKVEAGKAELVEEAVDIAAVVRFCVAMVKKSADENNISIEVDLPDDLAPLYGDEVKLRQILINLISNAVKFTRPAGKVAVRIWSDPGNEYVFQVADNGIGIAGEEISVALAPFEQVNGGLGRNFGGTGLGLPLTKALVELHGGSLDLRSEVGVGTTVTVRFPADRMASPVAVVA